MGASSGGAPAGNSMPEIFGPPRCRPLLSNTLRTLSRIYSLFPEENPFAEYADCGYTPAVWQAISVPRKPLVQPTTDVRDDSGRRSKEEASVQLESAGNVEVKNRLVHVAANNGAIAEVLHKDNGFNGSEMVIDELNEGKETETVYKVGSNEEDTNDHLAEVHNVPQGLLGIERILMGESDDLGLLQLSDKDFDILKDFANPNGFGNDSVPAETSGNDNLPTDGHLKEDVVVENEGKDMEAKKSTSQGNAGQSHGHVPTEREKSGCAEVGNQFIGTSPQDVERKDAKVYRRKVSKNLSENGGLTFSAQSSKDQGGTITGGKVIDPIEKGHKSGALDKRKTKKSKKAALKDVKSGKRKCISIDGEGSSRTKFGGANSAVTEKMMKLNVQGNEENLSTKPVGKSRPAKCEMFQYTREQLMDLRELAAIPDDILKSAKEISAQLHGKEQTPTVKEALQDANKSNERQPGACLGDKKAQEKDGNVGSRGQLDTSTADNNAEEKVSGILKKRKRGSSSETRKEKKKQKRRKKRAELNKKLGVKKLKLKPMKPKVISHCRHYLKGRCQEGEKCKFSHDVIPLTKSKPCCHFARHTCMKGDDCPFNHQLSKYPCNNYVETGFCSRGDSCLFSHKVSVKEASEARAGVSKNETCSLDQLDKPNPTQPLSANVVSSGITKPTNLKENLAAQISKPLKAPKGLSFLSFGKPSLHNSAKHEKADISRRNVNIGNAPMSTHPCAAPQRVGFPPPERSSVESYGTSGLPNPAVSLPPIPVGTYKTFMSFPDSLTPQGVSFPSVDSFVPKSQVNADVALTSGQPKQRVPGRADNLSCPPLGVNILTLEKRPADSSRNGMQASQSPYGSDHKLQVGLSGDGHNGSHLENRNANESDKWKAVDLEPRGSPSSGQGSIGVGGPGKSPLGAAQRALLSTLAFASKYESGIKMSPTAATEVKKDEGTSGSGCKQKAPMKASAIFELLYGGGSKGNTE